MPPGRDCTPGARRIGEHANRLVSVPVKMRTTESFPDCGWMTVLQTCATTGPPGLASIGRPSASVRSTSSGDGNCSAIVAISAPIPMPRAAEPTSTGHDLVARVLVVQVVAHFVERRFDALEQFFEQMIVEIAERFEQFLARRGEVAVIRCRAATRST